MKKKFILIAILLFVAVLITVAATTLEDFFLPGSQVGQSGNLETPDKCDNCHGGYNQAVEPAFNWRGSMMSQAARDPLFYACLAIANQDAPGVGDMCLRCHTPDGWLNGRCVPTDGSALNNNDRQGVQCDFCHKMVKPTPLGVNPFPGNTAYTSTAYGSGTYTQDQTYLAQIIPLPGTTANGMYIADANNAKRGPFSDAVGRHQMFYSPFHSQSDMCGTCHDVSNPVFTRITVTDPNYSINPTGVQSPTFDLRLMFPVERTYSEWLASGYNSPGTANNKTCQDCHMKDVTGKGAKMVDAPLRTNLPLHDMTGGNTFAPLMIKQKWAAEVNAAALDAGIVRARNTLKSAADLELNVSGTTATVKVINKTGHKLPTGYPEGRRMWINLQAYDAANNLIYESGHYDLANAELNTTDAKVYHCEPGLSQEVADAYGLPVGPSYHFAINSVIYHDNRIPPAGSTNASLTTNQSPVIGATYADGQNWDITTYALPSTPSRVVASLYYQTTTKEYVEFLKNTNTTNTAGTDLYNLWLANGKSAPELMNRATWGSQPQMIVRSMTITRIAKSGGNYLAQTTVTVTQNDGPTYTVIPNATVTASFSGNTSGTVSGVTGANGTVVLSTSQKKNPTSKWCFNITNVTASGYAYNAAASITNVCEAKSLMQTETAAVVNSLNIAPNPVVNNTKINYSVATSGNVTLVIYDNTGKRITLLDNKYVEAGEHSILWDASSHPSGAYYCILKTSDEVISKKMMLIK